MLGYFVDPDPPDPATETNARRTNLTRFVASNVQTVDNENTDSEVDDRRLVFIKPVVLSVGWPIA